MAEVGVKYKTHGNNTSEEEEIEREEVDQEASKCEGLKNILRMAVVITGHFALHFHSFLIFPFALAVDCVIGVSRLYTKSRFPNQLFGSAILRIIELLIGLQWCEMSSIVFTCKNHALHTIFYYQILVLSPHSFTYLQVGRLSPWNRSFICNNEYYRRICIQYGK